MPTLSMEERGARNIAIIGGGFSGAAVALNLLRQRPCGAVKITVVEPRQELGGGVAYSTQDLSHRLNVPASRMTVLSAEPGAFDAWFKASGGLDDDPDALLADGRVYPRRSAFGAYVGDLLRAAAASPDAAEFQHIQRLAVAVARRSDGAF